MADRPTMHCVKVALAIAPWSHAETYPPSQGRSSVISGKFGMLGGATPPLSLLYLSSCLKQQGHETCFVDGFFVKGDDWLRRILGFQPDLVGLWSSQFSWERNKRAAIELKDRAGREIRVVVGGNFVTAYGAAGLEEDDSAGIDYLITGDGEKAVVELCEAIVGHRDLASIQGLVWRRDGRVTANAERPFEQDLDAIPFPDYDLLDIGDYAPAIGSYKRLPSVNMMTVRGCAGECTFCHAANSLRERSVGNVIEEIRWLQQRHGVRHLLFFDETFTYFRERVVEFCHALLDAGIRIQWTCNSRVDTIDPELLDLMKRAGCWRLQFGAESGVQKQLDTIEKGVTLHQIRRGIEMTRAADLDAFASFMFGIPGETYEEGLETIRFARSLPLTYCNFLNFIPLCGSAFWKDLDQHGQLVGPTAFHLMSFVPHSMTREQLADLMVRGPKSYYFRTGYILRRFFAQRSIEDVRRNLRGFLAFARTDAKKDYLNG